MKHGIEFETEFNGIVKQYYEKILKFCAYTMYGNMNAAEDCTQDVFLILYQNMEKLQDYDKIGGWLYKTASNITKQYAAALGRERKHTINIASFNEGDDISQTIPAALVYSGGTKDEGARIAEENAITEAEAVITQQLKPMDEQILRLAFKEKRPLKEVAAILDMSLSAVKSRTSRLRQKISGLAHATFLEMGE